MARPVQCFRVEAADFGQLEAADQLARIRLLQSLAASTEGDFRLFSYTMPWNEERWRGERAALARRAPLPWQKRSYQEEIRLGAAVAQESRLQSARHYLLLYDSPMGAGELGAWGLMARPETSPPPLAGRYAGHIDYLYPVDEAGRHDPARPYAAVIGSYSFREQWDWVVPLARLLAEADGPLVLCLDCKGVSQRKVEFQANQAQADSQEARRISDQESLTRLQDARAIMEMVTRGVRLHNVRLFVLLLEKSLARLRRRLLSTRTLLSPFMKITELKGAQHAAALIFSPAPNPPLPDTWHNVLSTGVGHMLGTLGYATREAYDGLYIGIKQGLYGSVAGLKYHNPWQGQKASHTAFFGKTGYGKTVAMQALLARVAASGAQVVFLEPQGHSRRLAAHLGEENVAYHRISHDAVTYNPLDVVAPTFAAQLEYFLLLLEFLLNPLAGQDPGRPRRTLTNQEIGAVHTALGQSYAGLSWEGLLRSRAQTPLLSLFVAWLGRLPAGRRLAEELGDLYVSGPWAGSFNAPSTLAVQLARPDGRPWPAVVYDLSLLLAEARGWLPFYYFVLLSSINRESRRAPAPGQARLRRVVAVDELRYVTGGSRLVSWLADQIATARTFRVAYWLADQNPRTLAGLSADGVQAAGDSQDIGSRLHMLGNIETLMAFHLERNETAVMQRLYPELTASHLSFLNAAGPGQVLMKTGETVDLLHMRLTAGEWDSLIGS